MQLFDYLNLNLEMHKSVICNKKMLMSVATAGDGSKAFEIIYSNVLKVCNVWDLQSLQ